MKKKTKWATIGIVGGTILGYACVAGVDLLEAIRGKEDESGDLEEMKKKIEEEYNVSVKVVKDEFETASYDPTTETVVLTGNTLAALHEIGHIETHQAFKDLMPNGAGGSIYEAFCSMGLPLAFMMGAAGAIVSACGNEKTKKLGPMISMSGGTLMVANETVASFLALKKLKGKTGNWPEALKEGSSLFYWLGTYLSIPLAFGVMSSIAKTKTKG